MWDDADTHYQKQCRVEVAKTALKPCARRSPAAKPATVSASALAQHLDCTRTYVGKPKRKA